MKGKAVTVAPEFTPVDIYKARFRDELSWNEMRARFGVKWNSTKFYMAMSPHAKRANILKKHQPYGTHPCPALVRAVERAAAK